VVFVLKTQIQTTQDCSALVTQDITEHKKTTSMENAQRHQLRQGIYQ